MMQCKNCLVIRYFLIAVFLIVVFGLVFTEKTKYLSFIKPVNVSYLILVVGLIIFGIKVFQYFKKSFFFNKSYKVWYFRRKSSKSMPRKKIDWPVKPFWPTIFISSPEWFVRGIRKVYIIYFRNITFLTNYTF